MIRVLFVCSHNSARSQMAEAFLENIGNDKFEVDSAGLEPGTLNPFVVQAMQELDIDISANKTTDVFDLFKAGRRYEFVVTVCDADVAERCPIFPGVNKRLHWSFDDPSKFSGTEDEILIRVRRVRDEIRNCVTEFYNDLVQQHPEIDDSADLLHRRKNTIDS